MNNVQRDLIRKLMIKSIAKEEFLDCFKVDMGLMPKYIRELLEVAFFEKNADDVEFGLFVGFTFNLFSEEYVDILCSLIEAPWHYQHENIAMIFRELKSSKAIESLYKTAVTQFEYLDYDESYALAVKCIWALGSTNNSEAYKMLEVLAKSDNEVIRDTAIEQLDRIR